MKAQELIDTTVMPEYQGSATVIAHIPEHESWWHVHRDEEVPEDRPVSVRIKALGFKPSDPGLEDDD